MGAAHPQPAAPAAQQRAQTTSAQPLTSGGAGELEMYPIRLEPEQSLLLFGFFRPKKTLTWQDVVENRGITLRKCIHLGITAERLCRMQPDIGEWIRHQRTNVNDCQFFEPWHVNVFTDLGCTIGELVLFRKALPPKLLVDSGIDFRTLRERHGLTPDLMIMLKYSVDDWVKLRIEEDFLVALSDEHWLKLFGLTRRAEVIAMVRMQSAAPKKP